jgi:hypothetical protein
MYHPEETRRADEELRILAAVKRKMGAKRPVFGDFAQRKCPVFLTTYARFGKLQNLYASVRSRPAPPILSAAYR